MEVDHVWVDIPSANYSDGNGVFASSQFWFADEKMMTIAGGYMGSQVMKGTDGSERRVFIFSTWDSDPKASGGRAARVGWTTPESCARFGGEGVGSHCILDVDVMPGTLYNFRFFYDGANATGAFWTGVVTASSLDRPLTVGTLFYPHVGSNVGFGYIKPYSNEFLEYFDGGSCDGAAHVGIGTFGPFFHNRKIAPASASPAYSTDASACNRTLVTACIPGFGCGFPRVFVTGGKGVVRNNSNADKLWQ